MSPLKTPHATARNREHKAHAILQTIKHFINNDLCQTDWLDLGCGQGGIAVVIAAQVNSIIGIDPFAWPDWQEFQKQQLNLHFRQQTVEQLEIETGSLDIVLCNQVYEHVQNPRQLIGEIGRVLKPGGHCYFAGPNWLFPIEPHVFWPFVHWLPRPLALKLLNWCGVTKILDADSVTYWTLKRWFREFEVHNAIPFIVKHPEIYGRHSWLKPFWLWKMISYLPTQLIDGLSFLSPGFVFVLKKPNFSEYRNESSIGLK